MNPITTPRTFAALSLIIATAACGNNAADNGITGGRAPAVLLRHDTAKTQAFFDTSKPQVKNLDPALLHAIETAARAAEADGVHISITSGWRSRAHQQRLFDEAVEEYGSSAEAERHVSTPDKSSHVRGEAVDIGNGDADAWLHQNGYRYGLCQSFANERWHFELTVSPGTLCPDPVPDSSYR